MEELDIVIVGGGIAGLATSLALHRKGIKSVVLERSESVRSEGAAFGIQTNGWLALQQLGVADKLRLKSLPIHQIRDALIEKRIKRRESVGPASYGEVRGVLRNDLVRALAHALPLGTLRLGCQILSVKLDEKTSFPIVHVKNGEPIQTKVLIGCDGSNSVVSRFLGLNPTKDLGSRAIRGFTNYPDDHGFRQEFIRIKMDNVVSGRLPITHKLVFWFVVLLNCPQDSNFLKNQEDIARLALASVREFSEEWKEMVKNCDMDSLYINRLRYRAPWDVLSGKFRRGTVTVAGDSMHLMGPFLGQGCSAALEDGVVLARCLWRKLNLGQDGIINVSSFSSRMQIEEAIDEYIRERRGRLVGLSTQTYLTGSLIAASSPVRKLLLVVMLMILFRDQIGHTRYDCGSL
ncbi:putative FAD-binding domain, FAD/NAD(P)-binding domain superfamily [Arabidopsis thaliana]|uniref:FAD-binding domain n=1 Tax=Arabidopsis thaliana x Arabidopsis arenosa TaxID=1240361 RepID=A0A8T2DWS9_9BRAS|nr:FAD-binding domain [Arabidopsis thaliana x Arabidopsis arenosa]